MIWRFGWVRHLPDARFQVESFGGAAEFLQHGVEHAVVATHSVLVEIDPFVVGRPQRPRTLDEFQP